jgi:hypothetical protein
LDIPLDDPLYLIIRGHGGSDWWLAAMVGERADGIDDGIDNGDG